MPPLKGLHTISNYQSNDETTLKHISSHCRINYFIQRQRNFSMTFRNPLVHGK